jgi:hypothetical protein
MALPIRLTWNLQMSKTQKAGMFILFGSGWICIAFATLRVVQLGIDEKGRPTAPNPKWLLLWTILECSIGTTDPVYLYYMTHKANLHHSRHDRLFSSFRHPNPKSSERLEKGVLRCTWILETRHR